MRAECVEGGHGDKGVPPRTGATAEDLIVAAGTRYNEFYSLLLYD